MDTESGDLLVKAELEQKNQNFRAATELLNSAIDSYRLANDLNGLQNAYLRTGDLFSSISDYQKALENYFELYRIAKETKSNFLLKAYHKIGFVYQSIRDFEEAKRFFSKACRYALNLKNNREYSEALFALGNVYNWADELEESERFLLESLEVAKKLDDEIALIRPISSLAILYTKMQKLDLSLEYFNRGIELATRFDKAQIKVGMLKSLGNLFIARKEYVKAISTLKLAEKEAVELRLNNILLLIHGFFSDAYEEMGEYKKALYHHKKHLEFEKELMAEEINLKTKGLQIKFDLEEARRETEITLLKNSELEAANEKIYKQNAELELKNKDITDSIVYAERIQRAMLPDVGILKKKFEDSFVFYLPRDIVSGDFFWFYEEENHFIVASVDCTGHGVPGALMSMIGNDLLNHIVAFQKISDPSEILFHLNNGVKRVLKQSENESRDGMDLAICVINKESGVIHFAGANNPMWILRNNNLIIIPATKTSVGGHTPDDQLFTKQEFIYKKRDRVYLFTDGYADQFGGAEGKKFKYRRLKEILLSSSDQPMENQYSLLGETFNQWKGNLEQVDDVCVIGIEL